MLEIDALSFVRINTTVVVRLTLNCVILVLLSVSPDLTHYIYKQTDYILPRDIFGTHG